MDVKEIAFGWPNVRDARKYVVYPDAHASRIDLVRSNGDVGVDKGSEVYAACSGPVSNIGVYFFQDVHLRGRGFFFADGVLIDAADLMPQYVRDQIALGQRDDVAGLGRAERYVAGASLLLPSEGYPIYGHWLVDILPRAWLFVERFLPMVGRARFLKDVGRLNLVIPADLPVYGLKLLQDFFGLRDLDLDIVQHDWLHENLLLEKAIVPSLMHNSHLFHPATEEFVNFCLRLAADSSVDAGQNLYVTRRSFQAQSQSYKRSLVNEDELLLLLKARGFRVVTPEDLSWKDQIAVFAKATTIIGESGSGLHNAIFSPARARVLCFRAGNHVQASIAGLRNQKIGFLAPSCETRQENDISYEISPEALLSALNQIESA